MSDKINARRELLTVLGMLVEGRNDPRPDQLEPLFFNAQACLEYLRAEVVAEETDDGRCLTCGASLDAKCGNCGMSVGFWDDPPVSGNTKSQLETAKPELVILTRGIIDKGREILGKAGCDEKTSLDYMRAESIRRLGGLA